MTAVVKYAFWVTVSWMISAGLCAQQTSVSIMDSFEPEFRRLINHEAIDREQQGLLASDGRTDNDFVASSSPDINFLLTRLLVKGGTVDKLQYRIETDSLLDHRLKVNYLTGVSNLLKYVRQNWRSKKLNIMQLPAIIAAYDSCMQRDLSGRSIEPVISHLSYDAGTAVLQANIFSKTPGYNQAREMLVLKYCTLYPDRIFVTLRDSPDVSFADSLIIAVAKRYPGQLYNYAQASDRLGSVIRNISSDDFVRTVVRMSGSKSGQQYFPFLDNIVNGKMTFEEIDQAEQDSVLYYRLLVKTQMDYVNRTLNKDTALAFKELTAKLSKKAREVFVTTINGLHNEPDAVRFRCLQQLNAQELYYLAVLSDGLIYTSSYTNGVYPLMMKQAGNRGDSLLLSLHFDHYRKFISQAAAYNTLGSFLNSFASHEDATNLMKAFVGRLEESDGLEDGVDVADSYASIIETNTKLAAEVLSLVQQNYKRNMAQNNARGMAIYNILNKLFLSADSASHVDLTQELGIPPVYSVPFTTLANEKSEVVAQVFFYGDKDGQGIFNGFQNMFGSNWAIDRSNPQWITIRSTRGRPVIIYANKPLPEETGEDDKAQQALRDYLAKNNIQPTVTIHRGHSYFANATINYMAPSSRIVFMGSCGGFHLIDAILEKSEDAHIIASKQIGKTAINRPFFQLLTEKLRNGSDIDWIPFWKEFKSKAAVEGFEDYIPPYKNLGAIFIKAYARTINAEEQPKAF
ncbi:MAG: hypothetical protein ABW019_04225 [Chitinophagaceae bacterium]